MALAYLLDPSFQTLNENGRPLVGGYIEVYYHNSHLPYITKADFDGTNNPFKVPLNSKGMAVIIADVSNAYDVYCYDAFHALYWSRENVTIGAGGGGGGESNVEIFNCTEPDWPNPKDMFDAYNGGKEVVIVRQSFSGVNYSVWSLESVVKDSGLVKNYTLEFQNEEGSASANHKTNRVSFYSSDYENWTIKEKTFYYPERSTIAPNWSSLDVSNYKKGTLVYRAGVLYRCKTNTPSSSWVAAEWTQTEIAAEIVGGDSNIDIDFSRPVFVQQLTTDDINLNYDARLDNLLYKLPSSYKKVSGVYNISNATSHQIDTGISTDDGVDIELILAFFINTWIQYGQIVGNSYIDNNSHYFSVSCGASSGTINCFVNTNYNSLANMSFQNGSSICLRQTGSTRIAKDCYYPFNSYLASGTTGDANTSNIKIFTSPLVTIYSLYIKKGGVVVRDFIPCVRLSDNVAGFYDKISKSFFTNDDPSTLGASYP